ncbi:MAG: helix-hairpin-helix domain-containing protein [Planctomycetia bacterium]|nr:helix-hairpin-helix domain-containing protein [Planctomycetia bacterium]
MTEEIVATPDFIATLRQFNHTKTEGLVALIRDDWELITTKIEVQSYLLGSGFPHNLTEKLYRRFCVKTLKLLHRNPYLLLTYGGCGLQRVNAFALKNGFNPLRLKRQACILLYAMAKHKMYGFRHRKYTRY